MLCILLLPLKPKMHCTVFFTHPKSLIYSYCSYLIHTFYCKFLLKDIIHLAEIDWILNQVSKLNN